MPIKRYNCEKLLNGDRSSQKKKNYKTQFTILIKYLATFMHLRKIEVKRKYTKYWKYRINYVSSDETVLLFYLFVKIIYSHKYSHFSSTVNSL